MSLREKREKKEENFLEKLEALHGSYDKVIGQLQNELVLLQEIHSLEKIAFGKKYQLEKETKGKQLLLLRNLTKNALSELRKEKEIFLEFMEK